jgi:hypothetical protein
MPASALRSLLVAAFAALILSGCTGAPFAAEPTASATRGATSGTSAFPSGVEVEIYQTRFDYEQRVLEISVANTGASDLDLVSASFDSPHFADAATWNRPLVIKAGITTDLRVHLAEAVCTGPFEGRDEVSLTWNSADGQVTASGEALDRTSAIERITSENCLNKAVDSVVTITPGPHVRVEGADAASVGWVDMTIAPTGAPGTVSIDQIGATILLTSTAGGSWPVGATVDARSAPTTVTLDLRPARCDAHAVAEDKRGTIFPVTVSTSAGPSGIYDLPVPDSLRAEIYEWIIARCVG